MNPVPSIELRTDGTDDAENLAMIQAWVAAGATWLHVTDVEAAEGRTAQWPRLSRLVGRGLHVQFGGGIRHMVQIQQLIELGVSRVVLGTQAIENPAWLREVCRIFPNRIVLGVDIRDGTVHVDGRRRALEGGDRVVRGLDDAGLAAVAFWVEGDLPDAFWQGLTIPVQIAGREPAAGTTWLVPPGQEPPLPS